MKYKESDPFYHSEAWKRARRQALIRDHGMCRDCMERFEAGFTVRPNRATMVHHIVPRSERPDLSLALDNLCSLCDSCHNARHPERNQKESKNAELTERMRVIRV